MRVSTSTALLVTALLVTPWTAEAQVSITVCASGCDYTNLQTAIDAAQPGDTLLLRAGETFTGNFTLPDKGTSTSYITIRSDANDASLPPAGRRITPSSAAYLPKIRSGNSLSALTLELGAHHYRLMFLELQGNAFGFGEILQLGLGDASQNDLSLVPHHLILDRVYIHGDSFQGQKRCIGLNSASTTIVNSYISDCKGIGQPESQAIGGINGPGPYTIENNYLEGAGENVMFGGADPWIPNLVPSDITFRYNYLSKPLAWRDPILATPQAQASGSTTGGSLAAGTYFYRVQARAANGFQGYEYHSDGSAEVSATVTSGSTGSATISWAAVPYATEYRIYGRAAGAPTTYWTVTGTSFTDTGGGGTAMTGSIGALNNSWLVKNVFELKNARNVTISGNIMERSWRHGQDGFLVVFTPRNQDGACPWCIVDNVEMSYNILRHGDQGVQITGDDNNHPSQRTRTLSIHNNLFYDVGRPVEGLGWKLFAISRGPESVVIDHNSADFTSGTQFLLDGPATIDNLTITNNLLQHADFGVFGNIVGEGTQALNTYATSWTFRRNTLAGGQASIYPADNFFPTLAQWQAEFADYANNDFHLKPGSPYRGAGTDGKDLGVDMAGLEAATAGVLTGDRTSGGGIGPWQSADVGAVGITGSATLSGSTVTIQAGGTALWDTSDAFHYVYQPLTGDGEIVARVASLTVPAGANSTLGGVMIRELLTADSIHASMIITTTGKAKFRRRVNAGGITASDGPSTSTAYPPRWLKLSRAGDDFTASISDDGVTWTQVHTTQMVPMAETVYIGVMALRDGPGTSVCTATFENVSVRRLPSPWQNADVGAVGTAGRASHAGGIFTIEAGGTVLFDTADAFHYVYQPLNGDGEITVNLTGLTVPAGAESSMAAVMIREKLTEGSVHASMMITTAGKAKFRRRMTEGGTTLSDGPSIGTLYPPRWLRLTRSGDTFTAYMSSDGSSWTQVHTPVTVVMPANVHIGFMALRTGGTATTTATFRDVSVVP